MTFKLKTLFIVLFIVAVLAALIVAKYRPARLAIGMSHDQVVEILQRVNGKEISDLMQVAIVDGEFLDNDPASPFNGWTMWDLPAVNISVEAVFEDNKVKKLHVWDWSGRSLLRNYHSIQYDSVSEIEISLLHIRHKTKVIKVVNKGVVPPQK